MNKEEFLLKQAGQQSQVIDRLLKENASLRAIISTYLLPGKALTDAEKELIQLMLGNNGSPNFLYDNRNGKSGISSFHTKSYEGNSGVPSFHDNDSEGSSGFTSFLDNSLHGNSDNPTFPGSRKDGNRENKSGNINDASRIDPSHLRGVMTRLTPMMKTAPQKTIQNTAVLLFYWQAYPATAPAALRKLTGLSPDGMAKRVMAMKKAGLIVRYNNPLRYALTEKAQRLLTVHNG